MVSSNAYIVKLVTGFEDAGWNAYTNEQEKEEAKQVIIQQSAADIVKEDAQLYKYTVTIELKSIIDNDDLDRYIKEAIQITETSVTPSMVDWQIIDIDIQQLGESNIVIIHGIYVEYVSVSNI